MERYFEFQSFEFYVVLALTLFFQKVKSNTKKANLLRIKISFNFIKAEARVKARKD